MPARKKGRSRFDFRGRRFLWSMDDDNIRIVSEDKRFAIAYPLLIDFFKIPVLHIIGPEFPGIAREERRPVILRLPDTFDTPFRESVGHFINMLLHWCFDEQPNAD